MDNQTLHVNMHELHQDLAITEEKHIKIKSISLMIIAIVAVTFALDWGQSFFITLLLAIFTAYTLNPLVAALEQIKIPRIVGSTLVVITLMIGVSIGGIALSGQVESIIAKLPAVSKKLTALVTTKQGEPLSNIQKVQIAASQVESATSDHVSKKSTAMQVEIKQQKFKLFDYLWIGSLSFVSAVGQFVTVITLAYFLLISGDTFKRKLVKLTGPAMSNKKMTVTILQNINQSIQAYLFMLLVTNTLAGLMMWIALRWFGLENAGAWGVATGFMHLVPYFGPIAAAATTGIAAFIQFNSVSMALSVVVVSMIIATVVGVLITTWMTGRFVKMNATAVFVSLIFFTWLWGFWGMLLGIPVIAIVKVIAEHIEQLQAVAEILGE